jgi:hypothetical protein
MCCRDGRHQRENLPVEIGTKRPFFDIGVANRSTQNRTLNEEQNYGRFCTMGWIAKPGSVEDRLNQWFVRKNLALIFLVFSVFESGLFFWLAVQWLKPGWRFLMLLPLAYAIGAFMTGALLWKSKEPSSALWATTYFFVALPIIKMVLDSGIISEVVALFS